MFCERHPGSPAPIHIYVLEVIIFALSGHSRLSVSMHVCVYVCLFAWPPCQDIWLHPSPMEDYRKWQIKGLSLAAWQRTENYSRSRRCVCGCVRACEQIYAYMSACVRESSEETADPSCHRTNHFCDPPKNCPVFDARHWRRCCFHCPAGKMTMSLWCWSGGGE